MNVSNILSAPNQTIMQSFATLQSKLDSPFYEYIMVSISGGSDSDILIDMCEKMNHKEKIHYVFFNTGLEYQATKDHLVYLENKYHVKIEILPSKVPIPLACKKYGIPFVSKQVAENIDRLQKHGFKWEDKPYEQLMEEYPNCQAALMWYCNKYPKKSNGVESSFNIAYKKGLKQFLIANPPTFKISKKCCQYAKKTTAHAYKTEHKVNLSIQGIRKAEGGIRSTSLKNCFTNNSTKGICDEYRPIFWYKQEDKSLYEKTYNVTHSRCYTEYNMKRTGCVGCPFNRYFEDELQSIQKHEPRLFKAVNNIFGESYEYTRKFKEFLKNM